MWLLLVLACGLLGSGVAGISHCGQFLKKSFTLGLGQDPEQGGEDGDLQALREAGQQQVEAREVRWEATAEDPRGPLIFSQVIG